jgi:hypothetical protein
MTPVERVEISRLVRIVYWHAPEPGLFQIEHLRRAPGDFAGNRFLHR